MGEMGTEAFWWTMVAEDVSMVDRGSSIQSKEELSLLWVMAEQVLIVVVVVYVLDCSVLMRQSRLRGPGVY